MILKVDLCAYWRRYVNNKQNAVHRNYQKKAKYPVYSTHGYVNKVLLYFYKFLFEKAEKS